MRYQDAKKLHNEDEIIIKKTGKVLSVITVEVLPKHVNVLCTDGHVYHHTEIK